MPKLTMALNKVGRTINLATSNSYQIPRKPPLNTLIFEKLPEPTCEKLTCGATKPPTPTKPVRICTKEELQSFYCPPVCDCKTKAQSQHLSPTQKLGLAWLFKQTVKFAIVGGLIYYTYEEGIWSDAFKSSCFLGKYFEYCPPLEDEEKMYDRNEFIQTFNVALEEPEPCFPFIPHMETVFYNLKTRWNKMVTFMFWLIIDAPFELLYAIINFFWGKRRPPPPPEPKYCTS